MAGTSSTEVYKKCASLTPLISDQLFFPGPGGKSNKAKAFCSDCPFKSQCLKDAIREGLEGFLAGTTLDERRLMAEFLVGLTKINLISMDEYVPPPVGQQKTGRRVKKKQKFDPYGYLDELKEPSIEELLILDTAM